MRPIRFLIYAFTGAFAIFLFNEYFLYHLVLYQCRWPGQIEQPIRAMLIADTHLLGPHRGHWFDKLRREWQMHRTFQTSMSLFRPDIVFILGDVFDEGDIVNQKDFRSYVLRFKRLFKPPPEIEMYSIIGNHDAGFHYRLHPILVDRFEKSFNRTGNTLITFRNIHFVMVNSMTMEGDGCGFCRQAESDIKSIGKLLNCARDNNYKDAKCKHLDHSALPLYSQPILLQHFPTYRSSDSSCDEHDSPTIEKYRERWEVLSQRATEFLGKELSPRLAFSGHSHHYCHIKNMLDIDEYTIASFSWRNKFNPSFILAEFSTKSHAVYKYHMPSEYTVIFLYILYIIAVLFPITRMLFICCRRKMKQW